MDRLQQAQWFIDHGVAIFPVDPETKKAVVKGWQKYSTTPLSDEEKRQFLDMIAKGYNYAVPGGQNNLVILDFEDRELLKAWIGEEEIANICSKTLCVQTPHGGLHVYVTNDEIPPKKFNPVFVKENKGIADLQSFNSYVLGPGSVINHRHCGSDKCPWQGQDYTTQYTLYTNNEIGRFNLKQLLNFLAERGKKLGIELSSSAREWVYGGHRMKREEGRELKKPELKSVYTAVLPCFERAEDRRFNFVGHLSGYLARHNVKLEDAEAIVEALYNAVGLPPEHVKDVKYTYNDFENGGRVTGFPELEKLCEELGAPINMKLLGYETKDNENKKQVVGEKLIMSFDTLKIYHDFQHGKAYVSTYKAVLAKVLKEIGKKVVEEEEPRVKIDKTYVNENGEIKVMRDDDRKKLNEEYLHIKDLSIEVEEYPSFNLPTEIKSDVKISDVYKEVLEFIRKRIDTVRPEDHVAIVTWAIATYFIPIYKYFPYLAPVKLGYNSGGSQLLATLEKIVPRPARVSSPTPAVIYRMQDSHDPTMLIDELRNNINKDTFNAIYDILVAGYMKGLKIPRVGGDREVELFEPFGAKAVIDQSLVTSQYDIASRCLFVRLIRNPNRISDYTNENPKELVNRLYSVFLIYSPSVYSYYNNMDSGYVGRYDQIFRPLVTIARLIDLEDETLKVEEQLRVILNDTQEYAEAFIVEGDPQRKVSSLVIEYVKDSLGDYMEGKSTIIPKPWHIYENGEDALYIFISDLRRKVSEYAMYLNQKDIEYKYGGEGKAAMSEREWEKIDPELAEVLGGRQFIGILKKFFPNNIKEHRTKLIFIISRDGWNNLNFQNPPSRAETGGSVGGKTPNSYLSQRSDQNTNTSNLTTHSPSFGSHFGSEKKIQNKGTEEENTKSHAGVLRDLPLQFSNKNSEPKTTDSAQFRLDFGSEKKFGAENLSRLGSEKIESAQPPPKKIESAQTPRQQRIYDFLKKLSTKKEARTALKKLSREEVKLLPELREKGYINFDDTHAWLTLEGLLFISRHQRPRP